jgi:hypothetical protein
MDEQTPRRSGALQCFRILGQEARWMNQPLNNPRHCERSEAISSRESVGFRRPEIATSLKLLAMTAEMWMLASAAGAAPFSAFESSGRRPDG